MRILLVSLFHPELVRGGAQQVCYELFKGLQERPGADPFLLASVDGSLPAMYKSGARITGFDGRPDEHLFLSRDYDHWWHRTTDPSLVRAFAEHLEIVRPDVVHFHHFLTFGIDLLVLARRVLPACRIVFTLHEFMTICHANGHMVRTINGSLCERASPVRCHQCFPQHPPEDFFSRELWMKRHLAAVDAFTTPSRFMMPFFAEWGIDASRLFHVTNGQAPPRLPDAPGSERAAHNRFGFFGQMVDAKGLLVLIRAAELLRSEEFDDFHIEVNGDNLRYASPACREEIEAFMTAEAARPYAEQRVTFNGSYGVEQLSRRMARIDWCIVPSIWRETFCLVISEAWACGRPVIASNIGAMAERIADGTDGLLFEVGDPRELARTMRRACTEEGLWERLHAGIRLPPSRDEMVDGFMALYAQG